MSQNHEDRMRKLRARAAAYAMHAQHDSRETTRHGREAFLARFERQVDPDGILSPAERARRAESAKRAHFTLLAMKSAEARWKGGTMSGRRKNSSALYEGLVASWRRHLRACNKSPKTIKNYEAAAIQLLRFLEAKDKPVAPPRIRRKHLEEHIVDQLERNSASTAATRYRQLQQFFKWLEDEGEIETSPMIGMRPPKVPTQPVPVLGEEDLAAYLGVCEGTTFEQRRDLAIARVLLDTGVRLAELTKSAL